MRIRIVISQEGVDRSVYELEYEGNDFIAARDFIAAITSKHVCFTTKYTKTTIETELL